MAYRLQLRPRARRELRRLPQQACRRIDAAITSLGQDPRPRGCLKLTGSTYRIRVGPYRIIYAVSDEDELVIVGRIARRAEDTYDDVEELF